MRAAGRRARRARARPAARLGLSLRRGFGVPQPPVVRYRLPHSGVGDVLPVGRAHSGVGVEGPEPDAPDFAVAAATPERTAAPRAEALREPVVGLPLRDELLPVEDHKRSGDDSPLRRGGRARAALAARAVAIRRLDEGLGHLVAHGAAEAAAGEREIGHVRQDSRAVRTTAKADYAVRAAVELAAAGRMGTAQQIARAPE